MPEDLMVDTTLPNRRTFMTMNVGQIITIVISLVSAIFIFAKVNDGLAEQTRRVDALVGADLPTKVALHGGEIEALMTRQTTLEGVEAANTTALNDIAKEVGEIDGELKGRMK
jgi:hypothetical protein